MPSRTKRHVPHTTGLQPGAVRPRITTKGSQAHSGVSPLAPVSHRNTSFQPLPRPLGLPPYHYTLTDHFPTIGDNIQTAKKMVLHVMGDTGGVQDGEFQSQVAEQLIAQVTGDATSPQFCYHLGDVAYYTGLHDDYYAQFDDPYAHYTPPILSIPGNNDGAVDDPSS